MQSGRAWQVRIDQEIPSNREVDWAAILGLMLAWTGHECDSHAAHMLYADELDAPGGNARRAAAREDWKDNPHAKILAGRERERWVDGGEGEEPA